MHVIVIFYMDALLKMKHLSTLLDEVVVEKHAMVAAGALVRHDTRIPSGEQLMDTSFFTSGKQLFMSLDLVYQVLNEIKFRHGCNKDHHCPVHYERFSPGGESYASGSDDETVRIWKRVTGPLSSKDNTILVANCQTKQASALEVT
ncbi:serine-threonine kinase receptor-associated protein-like protein [Tanacetum coccineum]